MDLSGLGGESNVAATICIRQGDSYKCTWSKIPLSFTTEKTVTLSFTAVDTFGNTGSLQITRTFKVDPLAPIITKISAGLDH